MGKGGAVFAVIVMMSGSVWAADVSELEERVCRLEQCMNAGPNLLDGLKLCAGATMVIQGTSNANGSGINAAQNSYKGDDATDASYSVDIELSKVFAENGARAFLYLTTGEGAGVTDTIEVFSNVNHDADDSAALSVAELWWQQDIAGAARITIGKIDPTKYIDTNAYANDECGQFLGSMFRNSPTVEFSGNAFGVRAAWAATSWLEIETVYADGDADFRQIGDAPWLGLQASCKATVGERPGTYRVLYWYNDRPHTKWNDPSKIKESGNGFGISADQEISAHIGIFARAGWQDQGSFIDTAGDGITVEDFSLAAAYSAGVQILGTFWGRENDVCGFGYGIIKPSDDYKNSTAGLKGKTEGHLEAYYKFVCNQNLALTPDVQVITNPFGGDASNGDDPIYVAGMRAQISF
ncbi:MAG: carbohydrate porin [Candidatus Omnitrophica bacterium]|nr:carbohydrate porin [Candidatus Omnitrophota bacterium]